MNASHQWSLVYKDDKLAIDSKKAFKSLSPKSSRGPFNFSGSFDWDQSKDGSESPYLLLLLEFGAHFKSSSIKIKIPKLPVPITIPEQVESTHEAFEAGASIAHCHVRNDDETTTTHHRTQTTHRHAAAKEESDT